MITMMRWKWLMMDDDAADDNDDDDDDDIHDYDGEDKGDYDDCSSDDNDCDFDDDVEHSPILTSCLLKLMTKALKLLLLHHRLVLKV